MSGVPRLLLLSIDDGLGEVTTDESTFCLSLADVRFVRTALTGSILRKNENTRLRYGVVCSLSLRTKENLQHRTSEHKV